MRITIETATGLALVAAIGVVLGDPCVGLGVGAGNSGGNIVAAGLVGAAGGAGGRDVGAGTGTAAAAADTAATVLFASFTEAAGLQASGVGGAALVGGDAG